MRRFGGPLEMYGTRYHYFMSIWAFWPLHRFAFTPTLDLHNHQKEIRCSHSKSRSIFTEVLHGRCMIPAQKSASYGAVLQVLSHCTRFALNIWITSMPPLFHHTAPCVLLSIARDRKCDLQVYKGTFHFASTLTFDSTRILFAVTVFCPHPDTRARYIRQGSGVSVVLLIYGPNVISLFVFTIIFR